MYLAHFGMREYPFTLTPDTGYFFASRTHQEALNVLLLALRSGEGFIKVTGEVGTGKTMLCRKLLGALDEGMVTAYLPNPFLNPNGLRAALAEELGLRLPRNLGQHRLVAHITEQLIALHAAGKRVVLILDEAQALPDETMETMRLLTNLETERHKLLQVVLFAQPELDARLARPRLRQLRQRIGFACRLQPLDRRSLDEYLAHRLAVAGRRGEALFTGRALGELYRASRGIPRLANLVAHKALLAAFGKGARRVGPAHIRLAAQDTEDAAWRSPAQAAAALAALTTTFAGLFLWPGGVL